MKKIHIIEISVALSLIVSVLFSVIAFGAECNDMRNNIVRLHILANSDSAEDQEVKLIVRDTLLNYGSELFSGNLTCENAKDMLSREKEKLTELVNKTLSEKGFDYKAEIFLIKEYFTTRSYEEFTLPAGEYLALKVMLGRAEGKNWWCVMFPPLCLPAATDKEPVNVYIGDNGAEIIEHYNEFEMRFKIIEIYESIKNRIKNKIETNNRA